jgi:DNA repair exonuclease SbcCD ATPase subunit
MLNFKNITYKNILSVGNKPVEITFDEHKKTLITGVNGGGKSTLIEALSLVLYGKPFRSIKKPSLINSINKKQLLVELNLSIGEDEYKICRGIKPNVFSVSKNGTELEQHGASADFQEWLEENVLRMSFTTFKQIIVLGTAGFEPFMDLVPIKRRQIVEDLVDVGIFTKMSDINKLDIKELKTNLLIETNRLESFNNILRVQEQNSVSILESNQERIDELQGRLDAGEIKLTDTKSNIKEKTASVARVDVIHTSSIEGLKSNQKIELDAAKIKANMSEVEAKANNSIKLHRTKSINADAEVRSNLTKSVKFITDKVTVDTGLIRDKLGDKPDPTKHRDIIAKSVANIEVQNDSIAANDKRIKFFDHTINCPTCDTSLDEKYKVEITDILRSENDVSVAKISKNKQVIEKCNAIIAAAALQYKDELAKSNVDITAIREASYTDINALDVESDVEIKSLRDALESVVNTINEKLSTYREEFNCMVDTLNTTHRSALDVVIEAHVASTKDIREELYGLKSTVASLQLSLHQLKSDIAEFEERQNKIREGSGDIEKSKSDIEETSALIKKINSDAKNLVILQNMLKDDGIKAKIIKQYIPFINSSINSYLQSMGSNINFTLDEEFNEHIKSRGREEFTYNSFSQGEKMRIDVAIMFTWRDVIRKRTRFISNLLIMDEVMDSASDDDGIKSLHKLLDALDDNVVIISHSETHDLDKFDRHLTMQKKGNFTHKIG